ncbi:hypothetical protein B0H13DRAFT_1884676 [Mycena leptocephala]|nr:hypothetical protein B0H13DRAFT_1884676 [Mycena leptocephala]
MAAKTNMTAEEMVPDMNTPGHDPRYWCLPPIRDDVDDVVPVGGGFEFHLVTAGRKVGVWRDWTVAQTMITGYSHNGHKGHHSYAACVQEWQRHCPLGVHPHPVDPNWKSGLGEKDVAPAAKGKDRKPSDSTRTPRRSLSTPPAARAGPSRAMIVGAGPVPRYFAIWGGGVVYSTRYAAKMAFDDMFEEGGEPELLSTTDFDVALGYAEGDV